MCNESEIANSHRGSQFRNQHTGAVYELVDSSPWSVWFQRVGHNCPPVKLLWGELKRMPIEIWEKLPDNQYIGELPRPGETVEARRIPDGWIVESVYENKTAYYVQREAGNDDDVMLMGPLGKENACSGFYELKVIASTTTALEIIIYTMRAEADNA